MVTKKQIEKLIEEWLNEYCTHQPYDGLVCKKCLIELVEGGIKLNQKRQR